MEDNNVAKMCVREWWETPKTTPRQLRTLEIVLKDVESNQNWWFFWVFPIVFLVHWHILDVFLMFQLFSFFFLFLDKICTILSMTVDNKGHQDNRLEVRHHAVGDYSFLTQKKNFFLKIISSPPLLHVMNPTMHIWICVIYIR
jgi:hypothetical protein